VNSPDHSRIAILAILCSILLAAGCIGLQEDPSGEGRGVTQVSMNLETYSDSDYRVTGEVFIAIWDRDDVTFEDVTLCLFSADGSILNSTILGDFRMPSDERRVEISSADRPRYVVVDHPGMREHEMGTGFIVWTNDSVRDEGGLPEWEIQNFDYQPPERPGTCGTTS